MAISRRSTDWGWRCAHFPRCAQTEPPKPTRASTHSFAERHTAPTRTATATANELQTTPGFATWSRLQSTGFDLGRVLLVLAMLINAQKHVGFRNCFVNQSRAQIWGPRMVRTRAATPGPLSLPTLFLTPRV